MALISTHQYHLRSSACKAAAFLCSAVQGCHDGCGNAKASQPMTWPCLPVCKCAGHRICVAQHVDCLDSTQTVLRSKLHLMLCLDCQERLQDLAAQQERDSLQVLEEAIQAAALEADFTFPDDSSSSQGDQSQTIDDIIESLESDALEAEQEALAVRQAEKETQVRPLHQIWTLTDATLHELIWLPCLHHQCQRRHMAPFQLTVSS